MASNGAAVKQAAVARYPAEGGEPKPGASVETATPASPLQAWPAAGLWADGMEYMVDLAQRSLLFMDVMRRRGNQYLDHLQETAPHVLSFAHELVMDGRHLPRPVNYGLVHIPPPEGMEIDRAKRPFVVVDPRAGHGPGIGGFKADSEIGVALKAGHPCYFIGFLPNPVPGQTIEDVAMAEAAFLEAVIDLHPEAEGKPAVIGNCQAGWAVMMLAAVRPELFGPIIVAGSPLSYWAGRHGENPMRYTGGLVGGSWINALLSDLGNGIFDGAWLVQNFEGLNPANTLWSKQYNLFAKIDTEAPRYLEFEKWWGGHVLLTGEEIQFIVDKLFVGNELAAGEIVTSDGTRVDLRAIRSPIIVFCSKGDNITPPQQALGWILDLYQDVDDLRKHGQTIVYAIHETTGHLGIFVSGGVAKKEHSEFASNIDLIDVLPPGLYEAVLTAKSSDDPTASLAAGDYIARFEVRTLDDIRALGGNDMDDERRFATAEHLSEINYGLYRTCMQPWVRAAASEPGAEAMRRFHPLRLQYELLSDCNPFMQPLGRVAEEVRKNRHPAKPDNPFLAYQNEMSRQITAALDHYRDLRDRFHEQSFMGIYGSRLLQALVGTGASDEPPRRGAAEEPLIRPVIERRIGELRDHMGDGGLREAAIRAMIYVGLADMSVDERGFTVLNHLRAEYAAQMTLDQFKAMVREQLYMLLIDEERALTLLPQLVAAHRDRIPELIDLIRRVVTAKGPLTGERAERFRRIEAVLREDMEAPASKPREADAFRVGPAPRQGQDRQPLQDQPASPPEPRRQTAERRKEGED